MEVWSELPKDMNTSGYLVSNMGRFYIERNGSINKKASRRCFFKTRFGKRLERRIQYLVATVFIPNPHNLKFVEYKNDDNSDNRACNLFWTDRNPRYAGKNKTKIQMYDKQGNRVGTFYGFGPALDRYPKMRDYISGIEVHHRYNFVVEEKIKEEEFVEEIKEKEFVEDTIEGTPYWSSLHEYDDLSILL